MTQKDKRKTPEWRLVVGLGNPGEEYRNTYHNIGSLLVEKIVESLNGNFSEWSGKSFYYFKAGELVFIKPKTYMNESGGAVYSAMKHFGIESDNLLVVHDDADLPLGTYKIDFDRGSAGHNGIKSIIDELGSSAFWRIRIGVRGDNNEKAGDFVLNKIPASQKDELDQVLIDIERSYFKRDTE